LEMLGRPAAQLGFGSVDGKTIAGVETMPCLLVMGFCRWTHDFAWARRPG